MRNALAMSFSLGLSFWTLYFAIVPTLVEGQCYCDEVEGSGLFGFSKTYAIGTPDATGETVYVYGSCDDDEVGIRDDSCSWGRHKDWCCPIVPCEERRSPPPPASVPSTTSSDSCPSISESECRIACNGNMYWGDQNGFGTCTCFPGGKVCGSAPPPTRAPPTRAPPTRAPPTRAPPTRAPPTRAPPTASVSSFSNSFDSTDPQTRFLKARTML